MSKSELTPVPAEHMDDATDAVSKAEELVTKYGQITSYEDLNTTPPSQAITLRLETPRGDGNTTVITRRLIQKGTTKLSTPLNTIQSEVVHTDKTITDQVILQETRGKTYILTSQPPMTSDILATFIANTKETNKQIKARGMNPVRRKNRAGGIQPTP